MNSNKIAGGALLECHDVHYAYQGKIPALRGIDMMLSRGERVAFLGANGSGKSTLLSLLDGLIFPDKGVILYEGRELTETAFLDESFSLEFRKNVGLVFQNPDVQLFCPTVREDIAFGPLQLGIDETTVKTRLEALAETFRIAHLLDRSPHQLSVGEKRKVAFATVLAIDPHVMLLDEPTASLDPDTADWVRSYLKEYQDKTQATILLASHNMGEVERLCDDVILLQAGRVFDRGSPRQLIERFGRETMEEVFLDMARGRGLDVPS